MALLMCAIYTVPSGLHLEICFGFDGHIDATPDACVIDPTGHPQQHAGDAHEHNHHEDCLDIVIGCTSLDTLIHTAPKGGLFKTNTIRNDPCTAAGCLIKVPSSQSGQSLKRSTFLHNVSVQSPSLLSHQSVVIQI